MLVDTDLEALSGASNVGCVAATTRIFINDTRTQLQGHRVLKLKKRTNSEGVGEGRNELNLRVDGKELVN